MTSLAIDPAAEVADLPLYSWSWDSEDDRQAKLDAHMTFVEDVDLSEPCYSFDYLRVYVRKADGAILWGTDSGCSCPSPFEDFKVGDLVETNIDGLIRLAEEFGSTGTERWYSDRYSVANLRAELTNLVPRLMELGAK